MMSTFMITTLLFAIFTAAASSIAIGAVRNPRDGLFHILFGSLFVIIYIVIWVCVSVFLPTTC